MCGGVGPTKMTPFHDCTLLAVQWKAGYRFYTNSPEHNLMLSDWDTNFWVRCWETYSFHELAHYNMNCVGDMVESIHRDGPVTQAFKAWSWLDLPVFIWCLNCQFQISKLTQFQSFLLSLQTACFIYFCCVELCHKKGQCNRPGDRH